MFFTVAQRSRGVIRPGDVGKFLLQFALKMM